MNFRHWNYKSALFSSTIRALLFLFANLRSGWHAATGAMLAEFIYRAITAGFYGALTQSFRRVQPPWKGTLGALLIVPLITHTIEFTLHYLRGTPNLKTSMIASICFTFVSTSFNLFAMRRGALVSGRDAWSIADDMRALPALIAGFLGAGPMWLWRCAARKPAR